MGRTSTDVVVAADSGGTFTDVVAQTADGLRTAKVLSTPDDPGRAVLEGIERAAGGASLCAVVHGTTVGTNALLERRGARVAFVTNAGFGDLLHIGRQARETLYDLNARRPPPLVDRSLCFEVAGRLGPDGEEIEPVDVEAARSVARGALAAGAEAVAVCLLHAYTNPEHERLVAAAIEEVLAAAGAPDVPVVRSSDVLAEFREFERASTTVANAYLRPPVGRYLEGLNRALGSVRLRVMQSNGGVVSAARAAAYPVHTVLSGPAGGVVAAARIGELADCPRVLSFDMGGTSTDVSLCDGRPSLWPDSVVGGVPIRVPSIAIHTVGAGGGSIARVDEGGVLRVGPRSAGARPGPACYGRGGTQPTVTDANLVRGHLVADAFLGGEMHLDEARARAALERLAHALRATTERVVAGVCAAANAAMARALKVVSVQRGYDPREFALVAFGGAGGMHACELAEALRVRHVLVPPSPGLFSAMGLLWADVVVTATQTVLVAMTGDGVVPGRVVRAREALVRQVCAALREEGAADEDIRVEVVAEMRYPGQSWTLDIAWQPGLVAGFHRAHRARYGFARPERPVELVTLRVRGIAAAGRSTPAPQAGAGPYTPASVDMVPMMGRDGSWREVPRFERDALAPGASWEGPAVVTEYSATTVVLEGWRARVDGHGILHLERDAQ